MSIFTSSLRKNDSRIASMSRIGNESEDLGDDVQAAPVDNTPPAGESNVTGQDTENKVGLVKGEVPGVEVPGEQSDVTSLVEAEAAADALGEVAGEILQTEEVAAVALESIGYQLSKSLRGAFALEALAEQLDATVEGDGEGIDARTAQMVITANDALAGSNDVESGMIDAIPNVDPAAAADSAQASADPADVGEVTGVAESGGDEEGGQVFGEGNPALEAFAYSSRIATESLSEEASNKSEGFFRSVATTITNITKSVKERVVGFTDFFKDANKVTSQFLAQSKQLDKARGKTINDSRTGRMRSHIKMTGDGTEMTVTSLCRELPELIDMSDDVFELAARLAQSLDPSDPQAVLREAKRYFQGLERALSHNGPLVEVKFQVPTYTSLSDLAAMNVKKAIGLGFDYRKMAGDQTYKVMTEQQLQKVVRGTRDIAKRIDNWKQTMYTAESVGDGLLTKMLKQKAASSENKEEMRMARKAYSNLMVAANRISSDVAQAVIVHGAAIGHHAVMVTRSSLQEAADAGKSAEA